MYIVSLSLLLAIVTPLIFYYLTQKQTDFSHAKEKKRRKLTLFINIIAFTFVFIIATIFIFSGHVYANTGPSSQSSDIATAAAFIAAALVTGLGAIGTGIAVSSTAAAAIGAISENEDNFGKAMIFVAMAEGIAIYGLLISFMILGRV